MNPGEPGWVDIYTSLGFVLQALEKIYAVWQKESDLVTMTALQLDPEHPSRSALDIEKVTELEAIIVRVEALLSDMYDAHNPPSSEA
jgi:hypothetical protein